MKKTFFLLTLSSLCSLSLTYPSSVSARLTASPDKLVVGQRVTLTGTNMVSPLSGSESCTGPGPTPMDDCQFVTEVLFRRNGYDYKKGTIVPSASNDSQLVFVVPDMPSGTYGVEIWHRYPDKGFKSSGGDASIHKIEVTNPNPPSPKPSPQPSVSPSPSPLPTPSPSPTPSLEPTLSPLPSPDMTVPTTQLAAEKLSANYLGNAWKTFSDSVKNWWQNVWSK